MTSPFDELRAALDARLAFVADGTLTGTLTGSYAMSGALTGAVTLNVTFSGALRSGAGGAVERQPGTTHITGTAQSPYGTYAIDLTR